MGIGIRNSHAADTGAQIYPQSTSIPTAIPIQIQKPAPVLSSIDLPQRSAYRLTAG